MPQRMFKDSILTSESIFKLGGEGSSMSAEILFFRLVLIADDRGRFVASPANILSSCFPFISSGCGLDVDKYSTHLRQIADNLRQIVDTETVKLYENGGLIYGFFPKWKDHQRLRFVNPKHPPPPAELCNDPDMLTPCGQSADISRPQVKVQVKVKAQVKEEVKEKKEPLFVFEISIYNLYLEILPSHKKFDGDIAVDETGKALLSRIRNRSKSDNMDLEKWRDYFNYVAKNKFLRGENDRKWKASITWLTGPKNMGKVKLGEYERGEGGSKDVIANRYMELNADKFGEKP